MKHAVRILCCLRQGVTVAHSHARLGCLLVDLLCHTEQRASLGVIFIFEVSDSADKLKYLKIKQSYG